MHIGIKFRREIEATCFEFAYLLRDREFEGAYSADELNEYVSTMKKLYTVRQVVLKVNQQYIKSAAQADEYRTEPPFLLQGSYRNMNRIAGRTLPVMNDDELWTLILSSYEQDAQTLTSGAESNMLKFKELLPIGSMSFFVPGSFQPKRFLFIVVRFV